MTLFTFLIIYNAYAVNQFSILSYILVKLPTLSALYILYFILYFILSSRTLKQHTKEKSPGDDEFVIEVWRLEQTLQRMRRSTKLRQRMHWVPELEDATVEKVPSMQVITKRVWRLTQIWMPNRWRFSKQSNCTQFEPHSFAKMKSRNYPYFIWKLQDKQNKHTFAAVRAQV